MEIRRELSDTAFLVNESRARCVEVGRDTLARHWVPPARRAAVRALWEDFAREVYPHDALQLGLRNRFFLERIARVAAEPRGVLLNVAAGMTSYPYLVEPPLPAIEVDQEHVLELKRERSAALRARGVLPERRVELFAADLNDPVDQQRLNVLCARELPRRRSIAVLEGISYYLPPATFERLIGLLAAAQTPGSILALDFWEPQNAAHPVFVRLAAFFRARFGVAPESYRFLEPAELESLEGYDLVELADVAALERAYCASRVLADPESILPERYAVLARR